jgi:hypothetical protein
MKRHPALIPLSHDHRHANATLVAWGAGDGPPEQVNGERDVLL